MKELEYPFDSEYILKKSKKIRKQLLEEIKNPLKKKVAVLGGSTTHDIVRILDLFLLNQGIEAEFYESEYAQYWQDVMFDSAELSEFSPDLIYIHTSNRNISSYPRIGDDKECVSRMLDEEYEHFEAMWEKAALTYHAPIIQNNFEYPFYRLLGNQDAVYLQGRISFITALNERFYEYARTHTGFYINDINYMAAAYGLDKWSEPSYWHMYKYAMCLQAIPEFAFNLSNIIKSVFGKNKKSLVLDLDNTLWGGIIGDDGVENIEIGQETSIGQVFSEFQGYIKAQKDIGVMLNVDSKNEYDNAIAGLNHPDSILTPEDFILIKANWEPKSRNITEIAEEMNILPDSMVFVDDNPAEREIIRTQVTGVSVPEMNNPEQYIKIIDHSGFFEVTTLSEDDKKRNEMYRANIQRSRQQQNFGDYKEYLKSLEMKAVIKAFEPVYMARIAQLSNKSNQFNLTTRRYTQEDIERFASNDNYVTLYGKLEDKFGDNGVVSVVIGRKGSLGDIEIYKDIELYKRGGTPEINSVEKSAETGHVLHIELWLMSCRVLKRDMEYAMMDRLVEICKGCGIDTIIGYYYPTAKNAMVREFYAVQGFERISQEEGVSVWKYDIPEAYEDKNTVITVNV